MRTLILGGARSGKSALAERLAAGSGHEVVYIATAQALDEEMAARIARHRADRPAHWHCMEEPLALAAALRAQVRPGRCVVVDCLTLWLTNLFATRDPARLAQERDALLELVPSLTGQVLLVSNEIGLGVVPMGELTRRFVDEAGRLHQALASQCDRVLFVAAGLPLALKGSLA
ncbi:bifunctional adenosylcobinamide kinase/adenosylcobinamide-phosphate guanylyltransferase [Dyella sp. C9]|uniref:bifunctional adenosylcobinamide kinase/adenosylcobinamide-phosphate guanylyltransferase n=1 Tax=Dyella sp. C9 TaxID=2202154 RepID=UPI000DEF378E|nr:bifunctional adenosylcobinamide kinase/adenosylcobinamide-phosphate guanylyltransferase [Dyella sp. C9]